MKFIRGERDIKEDDFNHQHLCELQMLSKRNKCPYGVKKKEMSWDDKCDLCSHLRIVCLNSKGNVITSLNELKSENFDNEHFEEVEKG